MSLYLTASSGDRSSFLQNDYNLQKVVQPLQTSGKWHLTRLAPSVGMKLNETQGNYLKSLMIHLRNLMGTYSTSFLGGNLADYIESH